MKNLEFYVRSSPLGKADFHWRKIENGESILGYPHILEQTIIPKNTGGLGTIEYVINYQKLSFVLMRHSQQLLLLVAGIEALEERSNQLGSTIFNAVAWVANPDESNSIPSENELKLRHLAARALLSFVGKDKDPEFINTINEAIDFEGLEEFKVDLKKINQLTDKNSPDKLKQLLPNLDKPEGDQQIWDEKVEKTIKEQKIISLAEKIIKTELPKGNDLAILISKVDENAVSVLSIDLETEIPTVSQVQEYLNSPSTKVTKTNEDSTIPKVVEPEKKSKIKLLLIIFMITSLLVLLLVVINSINKEKPEKIPPIPQTLIAPPVPVNLIEMNHL